MHYKAASTTHLAVVVRVALLVREGDAVDVIVTVGDSVVEPDCDNISTWVCMIEIPVRCRKRAHAILG